MKVNTDSRKARCSGSALVMAVVLLAVAGVTLGSIIAVTTNYARQAERATNREKAMFLADAGLHAAMVQLNESNDGIISFSQSKKYFSDKQAFAQAADWGFQTSIKVVNNTNVLVSTGKYLGSRQKVQMAVQLGAGSRSVHALYAHACFAGNNELGKSYVFEVGGSGYKADFIRGDVYSGGDIALSGDSFLRLPELLNDSVPDGVWDPSSETWADAYTSESFTNQVLTAKQFNDYKSKMAPYMNRVYNNGVYDFGEAFLDSEGNGVYDLGEPFTDTNGNGVRDAGDGYVDNNGNEIYDEGIDTIIDNGNGVYDEGEEWTDDPRRKVRQNGRYDPAGGYWKYNKRRGWRWKTYYKSRGRWYSCRYWPAEEFEDSGNDNFDPGEPWQDGNGIYDEGEEFVDDRNGTYDYGTQARGTITGMPSPSVGQQVADGGDAPISPPDLSSMYYHVSKNDLEPVGALSRWGHDVAVTASDYGSNGVLINDDSRPEHIFVRNVRQSPNGYGNGYYENYVDGVYVLSRGYSLVYDDDGRRVDDYFLEDPTDPSYNDYIWEDSIDGSAYTAPSYVNVKPEDNVKVYYVDGNLYLHSTPTWSLRFREPGTRITIVAKGNITISDEFYYNADYDSSLQRSGMSSTVVKNPSDALCLIALKNPKCENSGNIYIGDPAHGTGGSIHAMLYAENNFIDNNINTYGQPFISIFGNMSAGNQIQLNRAGTGSNRTRLDITLDERIKDGKIIVPGLPHPVGVERSIQLDSAWRQVPGTWNSWSPIK